MNDFEEENLFSVLHAHVDFVDSTKSFLYLTGEKKSGIYRISNSLDNKIYIGSSKRLPIRWKQHIYALLNGKHGSKHFQNFFNKYKNFELKMEILEECEASKLLEREQFYLNKLKPFEDNGFNMSKYANPMIYMNSYLGKKRPELSKSLSLKFSKPLNQYDLDGVFIKHYKSLYLAHVDTGLKKCSIANAAYRSKMGILGGFIWREHGVDFSCENLKKSQLDSLKRKRKHPSKGELEKTNQSRNRGRKVAKYNVDGLLIEAYESLREAAIKNSLTKANIRACCRGKIKHNIYAGFKWLWASEYNPTCNRVGRFSLNGEMLESFDGASLAERTGLYNSASISKACNGVIKTYRGFLWKYI